MDATRNQVIGDRAGVVLALAFATVLVTACGGASAAGAPSGPDAATMAPEPSATAASAPDGGAAGDGVCGLVDASLASEALGGASLDGGRAKHSGLSNADGCVFRDTATGDWVSVWVTTGVTREDWESTVEQTSGAGAEAVDGLGDAGYRYVGSTTGLRIDAIDGGIAVAVQVSQTGLDAQRATAPAETIVRSLFDRLG